MPARPQARSRHALRTARVLRDPQCALARTRANAHRAARSPRAARSAYYDYISLPTSGASASIRRRSSSVVSARRNRDGAAIARVGSRASLRQEKRSASWALPEKTALHRRPAVSENSRSLPDDLRALRGERRGMLARMGCPLSVRARRRGVKRRSETIGIGSRRERLSPTSLPHHRTCGSASGGSVS